MKPAYGGASKIIKIEISDANKVDSSEQMCKCDAELYVQYAVKNILLYEVYNLTKDEIDKITLPLFLLNRFM